MEKTLFFTLIISAVVLVTSAQLCLESSDCPEGSCCMGYIPFVGACRPLGIAGEKCLVDEKVFSMNDIHVAACPCTKGLLCQGKVKKGIMKNSGTCQLPPLLPTTAGLPDEGETGAIGVTQLPESMSEDGAQK